MSSNSPPINLQWPDPVGQSSSKSYALSGRIMLASITSLFAVVVILVLLHLYARCYLLRLQFHHHTSSRRRNRPTRIVFYVDTNTNSAIPSPTKGLDASVLKSLPLFVFSPESDGETPECAVCLSAFEEGETGRVLLKCRHTFHIQCIDMWFFSHSTCPLCRAPVEAVEPEVTVLVPEPGSDPVQEVAEAAGTTSFADRMKRVDVRIDVPNRNESPAENELRSPGSRLLSLKRIMNMSRKSPASGGGCGPVAAELDVESTSQESTSQESNWQGSLR